MDGVYLETAMSVHFPVMTGGTELNFSIGWDLP